MIGEVWHCGICQAGNYDSAICRKCETKREDCDIAPVDKFLGIGTPPPNVSPDTIPDVDPLDKKLIGQINDSPEPLRSYIHGIETGSIADVVWQNEKYRQEIESLRTVLSRPDKVGRAFQFPSTDCSADAMLKTASQCPDCFGSGLKDYGKDGPINRRCPACKGTGRTDTTPLLPSEEGTDLDALANERYKERADGV